MSTGHRDPSEQNTLQEKLIRYFCDQVSDHVPLNFLPEIHRERTEATIAVIHRVCTFVCWL
jgi:hypothetical protein